jgi:hypothetical protein
MFCVVRVTDVQPEIRPEVTEKVWESFENPPSPSQLCQSSGKPRATAWQATDYPDPAAAGRIGSGQAEISKQKMRKETKILFCPN